MWKFGFFLLWNGYSFLRDFIFVGLRVMCFLMMFVMLVCVLILLILVCWIWGISGYFW